MGNLVKYVTSLHQSTNREYIKRMVDGKVNCMLKAKEYEFDYWDGSRRYGYGGYKYMPGRWKQVAELLIKNYNLTNNSSVLDVGCGKGFLLYEMKLLLPNLKISGFDISKHGIEHAKEEIKKYLFIHRAQKPYPFKNKEFDLVISLGCLHNLKVFELEIALKEIERVGKQGYIMLESYRSEKELFNLQCWALTCESFFNHKEWVWIYNHFGYTGDYEFIYFE
jgi:ubiquinone/menaquinone biosynthesis C-methylase UbiE|tara:strand:- start:285 stop:950 length:666 start_codon:yes stop_codon:yes gene_type:complete